MVREYIGARYVPKFMGAYDPTQIYEALCVVDNGSDTSYISKVPTPAGTPLTNRTYWAIYGAASGAILNLQNQIDDMQDGNVSGSLQNQIDDIENAELPTITSNITTLTNQFDVCFEDLIGKKIYIIGDSISDNNVLADNWAVQLKNKIAPLTNDVTISGINGASITYDSGVQVPSLTQRFNATSKDMDVLIIQLGVNDWILNHTLSDISGELASFMSEINGLATPPLVYWIMPFKNKDPRTTLHTFWLDVYRSYYAYFASSNGIRIIDGSNVPILNTMNAFNIAKYYLNDTYVLHPNTLGSKYICDYVFKKLVSGGDNSICNFVTTVPLSQYVATGVTLGQSILKFVSDGTCDFMLNGYTTPTTQEFKILDSIMPLKYITNYPTVPVTAYDSNKAPVPAWISMKSDGCLYINVPSNYVNQTVTFFASFSVNNSAVYDNLGSLA